MENKEKTASNESKADEENLEKLIQDLDVSDDDNHETKDGLADDDFIDDVALKDSEVDATDVELEARKNEALEMKDEGNNLFKKECFREARSKYTCALRLCPLKYENERSVLYSNRAACSSKEGRKAQAIDDCSKAIELNPNYLKAIKRRAVLYEGEDKLDESLEDYKKVFELDRSDGQAIQAMQTLPAKINERNEKLKEQMLGTLKDLGNKILRPFGLSTENFQLQQDPTSGGYSINFNQNKS